MKTGAGCGCSAMREFTSVSTPRHHDTDRWVQRLPGGVRGIGTTGGNSCPDPSHPARLCTGPPVGVMVPRVASGWLEHYVRHVPHVRRAPRISFHGPNPRLTRSEVERSPAWLCVTVSLTTTVPFRCRQANCHAQPSCGRLNLTTRLLPDSARRICGRSWPASGAPCARRFDTAGRASLRAAHRPVRS